MQSLTRAALVSLPHLATSELLLAGRSEHKRSQNRVQSTSSRTGRKVCALHVGISLMSSSGPISCLALGACRSLILAGLVCSLIWHVELEVCELGVLRL